MTCRCCLGTDVSNGNCTRSHVACHEADPRSHRLRHRCVGGRGGPSAALSRAERSRSRDPLLNTPVQPSGEQFVMLPEWRPGLPSGRCDAVITRSNPGSPRMAVGFCRTARRLEPGESHIPLPASPPTRQGENA